MTTSAPFVRIPRLLLVPLLFFCSIANAAQTIDLPVTIPFSLLETLVIHHGFREQGQRVTLINEGNQCIFLAASNPNISEATGTLRVEMQVTARMGTPLAGQCYAPIDWQGYLILYQQPTIIPGTWSLALTTIKSELYGPDRQPVKMVTVLWEFIESYITAHFTESTVDLIPPVDSLKGFLLPLFPDDIQQNTLKMLNSMRPGTVSVQPDSLQFAILADVEEIYTPEGNEEAEKLDAQSLERIVALWENWDALLSYLVVTLSRQALSDAERQLLMETLLETRHRFVAELSEQTLSHDFVRQQFVTAWRKLSPLFKSHLLHATEASEALGYLAFVSASDALVVFDRLGPTLGIEISRNGLIRLLEMLHENPDILDYRPELNPELQQLFSPENQKSDSQEPANNEQSSSREHGPKGFSEELIHAFQQLNIFAPTAAQAAAPTFKEILEWKVPEDGISDYITRVKKILTKASNLIIEKDNIPKSLQPMYRQLILATAWQESCFRQFQVKNKQLTYLLSYNQSSVGLMQINERVWRGIYDKELLRWDIRYNAQAGCEIAALYLKKYALRDKAQIKKLDATALAQLVYAMYNGGPAQYEPFFKRMKTKKFYKSDDLFKEKYIWVTSDMIDNVSLCLVGS